MCRIALTCGGPHVLVTSREPLGVAGEVVWRVPPLRAPGTEEGPAALAQCEAVELVLERARAAFPAFELSWPCGC
jgi:predicted ATPase